MGIEGVGPPGAAGPYLDVDWLGIVLVLVLVAAVAAAFALVWRLHRATRAAILGRRSVERGLRRTRK